MSDNNYLDIILAKCDEASKAKFAVVKNEEILSTIANRIELCNPKDLFIHTGSAGRSRLCQKDGFRNE